MRETTYEWPHAFVRFACSSAAFLSTYAANQIHAVQAPDDRVADDLRPAGPGSPGPAVIAMERRTDALVVRQVGAATPERPHCHCASVIALPDGSLLATWFAGAYETAPDQAILAARLPAGADGWSKPWVVVDTPDHADGQPVPWLAPDGRLWLFFVTISGIGWATARIRRRVSSDLGDTWGPAVPVTDEPGWMLRSRPLLTADGSILLPAYAERIRRSAILRSDDGGARWERLAPIEAPTGNIHPTLLRRHDGALDAYVRSRDGIWRATSPDDGRSWSLAEPTAIPNPDSGFDLIRGAGGALFLAYDDSDRLRTPLRVARSVDEGASWELVATLEDEPAEFSYPSLAEDAAGRLHCLYTARRIEIRDAVIDVRSSR